MNWGFISLFILCTFCTFLCELNCNVNLYSRENLNEKAVHTVKEYLLVTYVFIISFVAPLAYLKQLRKTLRDEKRDSLRSLRRILIQI